MVVLFWTLVIELMAISGLFLGWLIYGLEKTRQLVAYGKPSGQIKYTSKVQTERNIMLQDHRPCCQDDLAYSLFAGAFKNALKL